MTLSINFLLPNFSIEVFSCIILYQECYKFFSISSFSFVGAWIVITVIFLNIPLSDLAYFIIECFNSSKRFLIFLRNVNPVQNCSQNSGLLYRIVYSSIHIVYSSIHILSSSYHHISCNYKRSILYFSISLDISVIFSECNIVVMFLCYCHS